LKNSNTLQGFEQTNEEQTIAPNGSRLYDVALSTILWEPEKETINRFLASGREMGFCRFELNHQIPPVIFDQIEFNQFDFSTLHNPCPAIIPMKQLEVDDCLLTSLTERTRHIGVDILKNTIENAQRLAAKSVVIHAGWITGNHSMDAILRQMYLKGEQASVEYKLLKAKMITDREERAKPHLQALTRSLDEIISFASGSGLLLGLENLLHYYEMLDFEEMKQILDEFKQTWFGWQLDLGHVIVQENLGLMCAGDWLEHFSERIIGIHFHDVKGLQDHLPPGKGNVDFASIAAFIPSHTQLTFEISKDTLNSDIIAGLNLLEQSGCIARLI